MIDTIRLVVCKKCGQQIENRVLCGFNCEYDTVQINKRPKETIETRIFKFSHVE